MSCEGRTDGNEHEQQNKDIRWMEQIHGKAG